MKKVEVPDTFQRILFAAFSLFIGILLARTMGF